MPNPALQAARQKRCAPELARLGKKMGSENYFLDAW